MDNNNIRNNSTHGKGILIGSIIIIFGILLFLKNLIPGFPSFVFSWPMILITIGLIIGIRSNFRNFASIILIVIGSLALTHKFFFFIPFYKALILPATIIIIGCMIIVKDRKKKSLNYIDSLKNNDSNSGQDMKMPNSPITYDYTANNRTNDSAHHENDNSSFEEFININAYFGGQKSVIYSRNIKKGDITCVFGGADTNFRQADFQNEIVLDILVVCGGLELKMPSNWYLKNELTSILGGIDDKRNTYNVTPDFSKRVILRGTVLMGGIEIKN